MHLSLRTLPTVTCSPCTALSNSAPTSTMAPGGFFSGATNFTISGGTFNEIRGNLNQTNVHHHSVQYNQVNGHLRPYNSPTNRNFGYAPPPPNRSITDPQPPRRGAARGWNYHNFVASFYDNSIPGNFSGVRMEPYSIGRGSEPPAPSMMKN